MLKPNVLPCRFEHSLFGSFCIVSDFDIRYSDFVHKVVR